MPLGTGHTRRGERSAERIGAAHSALALTQSRQDGTSGSVAGIAIVTSRTRRSLEDREA